MLRENLYDVRVTIIGTDGKRWSEVFDKFDGGESTAKETKYRPANGLHDQRALGGSTEITNIKVTRLQDEAVDKHLHWLFAQNGKAKMIVSKQPIDGNGAPFGSPLVYTGLLNAVSPTKTDSESDSASLIELEQSSVTPVG